MLFEAAGIEVALWVRPLVAFTILFLTSTHGTSGAFLFFAFNGSSTAGCGFLDCLTVRRLREGEIKLSRNVFERSGAASFVGCFVCAAS